MGGTWLAMRRGGFEPRPYKPRRCRMSDHEGSGLAAGHHLGRFAQIDIPDALARAVVEGELQVEAAVALGAHRLDPHVLAGPDDVVAKQIAAVKARVVDVGSAHGDDRAAGVVPQVEPPLIR